MPEHNSIEAKNQGRENLQMGNPTTLDDVSSMSEKLADAYPARKGTIFLCLCLFVLVAGTYFPALYNDFVGFDDPEYVTANLHVQRGLTWANVGWAFRSAAAANWHPITWLSHMLDCQWFGLAPWGHHLTNVVLHAISTILVFLVLHHATKDFWRCFFVAAFFGLHPLRVESVAWVAERKDVLSTTFWLLTLWAYIRYAQKRARCQASSLTDQPRNSSGSMSGIRSWTLGFGLWTLDYGLALLFFVLGLMSKPMLVTLPFVLFLLDYWPLGRLKRGRLGSLALEKAPFFVAAAVVACVTFAVQQHGGTVSAELPLGARLGNAAVSYCRYLGKFFWPANLAVYYPYPGHWRAAIVVSACLVLVAVSILTVGLRQRQPHLFVGWFWYIGTLVPVIGLVQVGDQAMADRYSYVPSVGICIILIWVVAELTGYRRGKVAGAALVAAGLMVCCMALTRRQIGYWKNSEALFRHAITATANNYLAYDNLGTALTATGQIDQAIVQYHDALRIKPDFAEAHNNLGAALEKKGRSPEAIAQFVEALRLKPGLAEAHYNLGNALAEAGRLEEAISEFQRALVLKPDYVDACYNLGNTLNGAGRLDEAITQYNRLLKIDPKYAEAHYNLGVVLVRKERWDEAMIGFQEFLKLKPASAEAHLALGAILDRQKRLDEAVSHYLQATRLTPDSADAHVILGVALSKQGHFDQAVTQFQEALRLKPDHVEARKNLDAALRLRQRPNPPPPPAKP